MREQILKARAVFRKTLINNESNPGVKGRLALDLKFQKVLNEAPILLTLNERQKTVLGEKPPMISWCKANTHKDFLVKAKITNRDTKESKSARFNGKHCQVCQYNDDTCEFEDADGNKQDIRKGVIN